MHRRKAFQTCAFVMFACATVEAPAISAGPDPDGGYAWNLPKGFPKPYVPADNPMSAAKVELGRFLFYDTRMSVNGKASCATCHQQGLAFTDGLAVSAGATGESHSRGAMSLVNIAYSARLTWSNPKLQRLEEQALVPMFGDRPVELGLREGDPFLARLRSDATYREMFERAFPGGADPFTIGNVTKAIACFERSIISARSPYDRYHYGGDDSALSDSAKRGEILFFSQPLSCFRCHGGFNFSDASVSERNADRRIEFHNTGLYNLPGLLSYPAPNTGIYEYTGAPADVGKFKTPTLRNIALTAPYMHDGSIPTLEGVLDHYAAGGRTIASGAHAGNGHDNPNKDPLIGGFVLSRENRDDLIAFLNSLTDDAVLRDPRFANPSPGAH
ncbi:MAG TPA: di-heme enzyme [Bryobacteraceae bacterium]|nr:di-heme enzyme [Bryobacteraceae bacterium]